MRVYRYIGWDYGLAALKDCRLKLGRINDLNDPFEFAGAILEGSAEVYRQIQKDDWHKRAGLLCFSEVWDDPLMWAHYADNHRGLCLGFDVPQNALRQVEYVSKRISGRDCEMILPDADAPESELRMASDAFGRLMSLKHDNWKYEREWRLFEPLTENLDEQVGHHFKSFDAEITLKEVLVGTRYNGQDCALVSALAGHNGIRVRKVCPSFDHFRMVYDHGALDWMEAR